MSTEMMEPQTLQEEVETLQRFDLEPLDPDEIVWLDKFAVPEEQVIAVDEGVLNHVGRGLEEFREAYSGRSDILLEFVNANGIELGREVGDSGFAAEVFRHIQGYSGAGVEYAHVRLPVLEIHRPFVDGCATTAKLKEGLSRKRNISIKLLGATFSGGCNAEASCRIEHTVTRQCTTITYPARITFKKWVYKMIPSIKPIYTVKDIWIDVKRPAIAEGIAGTHGCVLLESDDAPVVEAGPNHIKTLDISATSERDESRLVIEKKYTKGRMMDLKVGVKSEAFPDGIGSLGFSLETSVLVEYDLDCLLKSGSVYSFRRRDSRSAVIWCSVVKRP